MNKILVLLALIICSCSTTPKYLSFDDALEIGMQKIENDLPEGAQVAILDFKSDNENLSSYIIEEMYDKLINFGKLSIMERSRTNSIAMEIGYQLSGEVDDNEIISIGHQLGADYVITGQITFSGEAYRLRVFVIDIEKGRRIASSSLNINPNDKQINYLLTAESNKVTNTVNDELKLYNIGDIGPAGGIVFYDKGAYSNGWRYLEAAPWDTQFYDAIWGTRIFIAGTFTGIGFGKQNTQVIVEFYKDTGVTGTAAQLCNSLVYNGYNDWFLPSRDELNLMYINLRKSGLGSFSNSLYWTSSQAEEQYGGTVLAWFQGFDINSDFEMDNGYQSYDMWKDMGLNVRAVRAF